MLAGIIQAERQYKGNLVQRKFGREVTDEAFLAGYQVKKTK